MGPQFRITLHRLNVNKKTPPESALVSGARTNLKSPHTLTSVLSANSFFKKQPIYDKRRDNYISNTTNDMLNDDLLLEQLKSRRAFNVEYDTYEDTMYTENYYHSKIVTHPITNTEKFSKRFQLDHTVEIPEEQTIQEEYRFKFPVLISSLENENTLAAHVLATMKPNLEYIEVIFFIHR